MLSTNNFETPDLFDGFKRNGRRSCEFNSLTYKNLTTNIYR